MTIISDEKNYVILRSIISRRRKELCMFDITKYDISQFNATWAAITAAVIGGWFVVVGNIAGSTARNRMKWLGIALVSLVTVGMTGGILYFSGVIPKPLSMSIMFKGDINTPLGVINVRSSPSLFAPVIKTVQRSEDLSIRAQLIDVDSTYGTDRWYLVDVRERNQTISGYILTTVVDLTPPPDHPNATPPLVTLTPTP